MAITADKLLNRSSEIHRRYAGRLSMKESLQEKMVSGGPTNIVLTKKSVKNIEVIKTKVMEIESILKGTLAFEKKALDEKKRQESGKRRENQEEKLETKPNAEKGMVKMPSAPRLGIFDWIKNFIGNIILGYFAVRLLKHLPKIVPVLKFIGNATDFVIDIGGKLLNGLATFIDWGYKAYDSTKGFLKNLGGEDFAKGFDKFIGAVDTALFLTTFLAADLLAESLSGGDAAGAGGGRSRPGKELERLPGGTARSGITKFARNAFVGLAGKGGAKTILRTVRPLLKRLPIIGALIDFGLSVALGESPGRAAFKAIGAGLLGSVGAAIGSVVPIAGNIIGGIVGGMAGDAIGGALYDMFFNNKKPQQKNQKVQKKAGGGITRGGKTLGTIKRTVSKQKYKRVLVKKPSKTQFKADPKDPQRKVGEELDKTKYFGPILAITNKLQLKEEPTQKDYDNVGLGLNLLIAKGIEDKQLKGGLVAAFAGGGMVDSDFLEAAEKGADISNWISTTFRNEFETNAQKTLRLIREKKDKSAGVPGPTTPGPESLINIQGGDVDFWTLVAVVSREDGEPQAWADVAQSIYNRLASGAYTGKTIKDLILGQMQYEPTWKFPRSGVTGKPNQEWYSIKDAASAGIAAGQSEDAMKKVAAAILDPTLQKNAREFIQGRTDFRGYSVSGGVQRKSGDNYFGWYNNYKANKIGAVPNFGATAISSGSGGSFVGGGTGAGYGSGGVKIAGDLGDYMKANKGTIGITGSIWQHPRHPRFDRRGGFSYHNQGRALDIGGYGPAHPSSGGRDEQAPVIRALLEWNKRNGYKPVEIIHGSPAFRGLGRYESGPNDIHSNHVHVAYHMGKVRSGKETIARILKDEKVLDSNTSKALDQINPLLAYQLNKASTKEGVLRVLQSYAGYELPYAEPQIIEVPVQVPVEVPSGYAGNYSDSSGFTPVFIESDPFETLYSGG